MLRMTDASRSCVMGRGNFIFSSSMAMALASIRPM